MSESAAPPEEALALQAQAMAALQAGDVAAAAALQAKAHEAAPDAPKILNNLGVLRGMAGDRVGALAAFRLLCARPDAGFEAWQNRGLSALAVGERDEARAAFARAWPLAPDAPAHLCNLGNACRELGAYALAETALDRAHALDPGHVEALHNRAVLRLEVGDCEGGLADFEAVVAADPTRLDAQALRVFRRVGDPQTDGSALLALAREAAAAVPAPDAPPPGRVRATDGRLRVALLSPDFREHACAYFLRPLFAARDRARLELHAYADFSRHAPDATSEWFRASADVWQTVAGMTPEAVAGQMRAAGLDVLVELAGYTNEAGLAVCAQRPAPVVASWLGFPASTGLGSIGWRIGDRISDPPGPGDAHFSEQIVRLPGPFLCYAPPSGAPDVSPPPSAITGRTTFGSFNNLHKINPAVASAWARIVGGVPGARLLVKGPFGAQPRARARLKAMFATAGLAPDRVEFADFDASHAAHLASYARVDVALDTFPYNGTTTTCEALWMGVPVVTFAGDRHAARVGASLLHHAGLGDFVARDVDGYVELATALGRDPSVPVAWRGALRGRMASSALVDARAWCSGFEAALRALAGR